MVTHCICARRSFADVLLLAQRSGWGTLDEVERATGCGARCGLCRPYLQATLDTGQTRFLPGRPAVAMAPGG